MSIYPVGAAAAGRGAWPGEHHAEIVKKQGCRTQQADNKDVDRLPD